MRNLFLVLFTLLLTSAFAQVPNTADSIYWSVKFCDTSETVEDCYESSYTYNSNLGCYMAGTYGPGMCEALWPAIWIFDSYDCCCKVASLPGSEAVWTGFMESSCPAYLDSIGFIYNDPDYVNWTSLEENNKLDGFYIDMYGIQHTIPPKGLSVKDRTKYIRL
tara:strand:- start:121 stop:609 length:489 start_codon:yes stop_codon:yes gene_type:complete